VVSSTHLGSATNFYPFFLIIIRQSRVCSCWAPCLARDRVCSFQLLLCIASSVFLGCQFFRLPQPGGPGAPGTGWPSYTPDTGYNWATLFLGHHRPGGRKRRYSDPPQHGNFWRSNFLFFYFCIIYKNSDGTPQKTHYSFHTKVNQLMLFREINAFYFENQTKP
jgi:hypothetical protein